MPFGLTNELRSAPSADSIEFFNESISAVTDGSAQIFGATGGSGVAVGVNMGVSETGVSGDGVSVRTRFIKLETGRVGVGIAELLMLQPDNRNIPDSDGICGFEA